MKTVRVSAVYPAVPEKEGRVARAIDGRGDLVVATAQETGLETASADVIVGEVMLTLQDEHRQEADRSGVMAGARTGYSVPGPRTMPSPLHRERRGGERAVGFVLRRCSHAALSATGVESLRAAFPQERPRVTLTE